MLLVSLYREISAQQQCEVWGLILDLCVGTRLKLGHQGTPGLQQKERVSHNSYVAVFQDVFTAYFLFSAVIGHAAVPEIVS